MENQLNNIGNHGGRLAVRFARLGQSGDAYQQAYLVLAKYMIDLTNATIDYASLPTAYQKEASQCFNTIKEVEGTYAQTLGNDLKRVPQQMMNDFMAMALLLTPAIEAAERLAGGSDCDDDVKAVNDFIKKAIQEEIEKQSQQIDTLNAAILQFDLMSDQFSQMVTSLDDVRSALLVIQNSWSGLNDELTEMQTEVKQINRDKNKEQWQTVADELRATATVLSEVQEHIKRLNVADLKVSVGAYNFDMSDDQLAAAYAEYNQVEFIEYLRTA